MQKNHRPLDDFFHKVSRYIIFVPLTIILIAVFFKFANNSEQKGFLMYNISPTPLPIQNNPAPQKDSSPSAKFNLTGPLSCSFLTESSEVEAFVKDKKIYIGMTEKNVKVNYLLNGDCVYIWKNGLYSGEKICGISSQVAIVEGLLLSGLIDPSSVFGNLNKVFELPAMEGRPDTLETAMSACKNEEIPTSVSFSVPRNVLFKNKVPK